MPKQNAENASLATFAECIRFRTLNIVLYFNKSCVSYFHAATQGNIITITSQPEDHLGVVPGQDVTFGVSVSFVPAPLFSFYSWLKDGNAALTSNNNPSFTLQNVDKSHVGNYSVRVVAVFSDGTGEIFSDTAQLTICKSSTKQKMYSAKEFLLSI